MSNTNTINPETAYRFTVSIPNTIIAQRVIERVAGNVDGVVKLHASDTVRRKVLVTIPADDSVSIHYVKGAADALCDSSFETNMATAMGEQVK